MTTASAPPVSTRWLRADILAASVGTNLLAMALPIVILQVYDRILPNLAVDTFAALAIELAKRIFGLYLAAATDVHGIVAYGSFTTVILLVLWAYYSSIVFLLGGVVAETWAERGEIIRTTGTFEVAKS